VSTPVADVRETTGYCPGRQRGVDTGMAIDTSLPSVPDTSRPRVVVRAAVPEAADGQSADRSARYNFLYSSQGRPAGGRLRRPSSAGNDPTARWLDFTMTDAGAGKSATACTLDLSKGLPELLAVLLQRPSTNAPRSLTTSTLELFKMLPEPVMLSQRPEFVLSLNRSCSPARCCWRSRSRSSLEAPESPPTELHFRLPEKAALTRQMF
jgi:hypothetical protein